MSAPALLANFRELAEAQVVKSLLEASGVDAVILRDQLSAPLSKTGIRLMVNEAELEIARRILEDARAAGDAEGDETL